MDDTSRGDEFNFVGDDMSALFNFLEGNLMNTDVSSRTSMENASPNYLQSFDNIPELPNVILNKQQPMMTTKIISSTSNGDASSNPHQNSDSILELSNVNLKEKQPVMTTTNIPKSSSRDKESSKITYHITVDDDDDYSLSYVISMGIKYISMLQEEGGTSKTSTSYGINQEYLKTNDLIHMPIDMKKEGNIINVSKRREKENPRTNDTILQQPTLKIPVLEKLVRGPSFMKPNFNIDHPLGILTSTGKENENPKVNDPPTMSRILYLERDFIKSTDHPNFGIEKENFRTNAMIFNQERDFMKAKLSVDHPFEISTSMRIGEQENPKTNGMIFQQPMPNISTLEKHLESNFVNPKLVASLQGNKRFMQGFCSGDISNKENEIRYGTLDSLNNDFPRKTSSNGGPVRRSSNMKSSRYIPFGGETYENKQGSNRVHQGNPESAFDKSQTAEVGIACNIGLASNYSSSSYQRYQIPIDRSNQNNEETLIGGRSSKTINHSNQNFQLHDTSNKFKGVAGEQNFTKDLQGNDYINQEITLGSCNSGKGNEDEDHDQLQSSWIQRRNTQDTHLNLTNTSQNPFSKC